MRLAQRFVMAICKDRGQQKLIFRETNGMRPGDPYEPSKLRVVQRQFRPALAWVVMSTARRNPGAIVLFVAVWSALGITEVYRGVSYLLESVLK